MYQLAAWVVLGVHATWVAFLLVGFPLGWQNCWLRSLHLGGLIFNMVVFLSFLLLLGSAWTYGLIRSPLRRRRF